jgi:hypothetical protein
VALILKNPPEAFHVKLDEPVLKAIANSGCGASFGSQQTDRLSDKKEKLPL